MERVFNSSKECSGSLFQRLPCYRSFAVRRDIACYERWIDLYEFVDGGLSPHDVELPGMSPIHLFVGRLTGERCSPPGNERNYATLSRFRPGDEDLDWTPRQDVRLANIGCEKMPRKFSGVFEPLEHIAPRQQPVGNIGGSLLMMNFADEKGLH
jgi:hypothetical protein